MQRYFHWIELFPESMRDSCEHALFESDPIGTVDTVLKESSLASSEIGSLLREGALLFLGRSAQIFESTQDLDAPVRPLRTLSERVIRAERFYLRQLAELRMGRSSPASWAGLLASDKLREVPAARARVQIEMAASFMHPGRFREAMGQLEGVALSLVESDRYTHTRYWTVMYQCGLALGRMELAQNALRELNPSLWRLRSPSMMLAHGRRMVDWHLFRSEFFEAEKWWQKSSRLSAQSDITRILLLRQLGELQLRRNAYWEAHATFERLVSECQACGLGESFVDISRERCEVLIGLGRLDEVDAYLAQDRTCLSREKRPFHFMVHHLLASACHLHRGSYEIALAHIREAEEVVAEQKYARESLEVALIESACLLRCGDLVSARARLRQATLEGGAPSRFMVSLQLMSDIMDLKRPVSGAQLLRILKTPGAPELIHRHLSLCGNLTRSSFSVSLGGGRRELFSIWDFIQRLRKAHGSWWFPEERVLVAVLQSHLRVEDFATSFVAGRLFVALISRPGGLTLPEIHRIRSSASFHPDRHGPASHALLGRLRQMLRKFHIEIEYSRESQRYAIPAYLHPFVVQQALRQRRSGVNARANGIQERILELVRMRGKAAVAEISAQLGMSRQALNKYLRALCAGRKLTLLRRGRSSVYILLGGEAP